jgi:predicted nucleic acid-binding Zn ribbon protein
MKRGLSSIAPILNRLTKKAGLEKGIASFNLGEHWEEAVGHQIATHTYPTEIRFTTLVVLVDEAVWMHQLSFMKKEIIEKVNHFLKKRPIQEIRFRIGSLPPRSKPSKAPSSPKREKLSDQDAAILSQQLEFVQDHDLKLAIQKAMRRHLMKKIRNPGSGF